MSLEQYTQQHLQNICGMLQCQLQTLSQTQPPAVQEEMHTIWQQFIEIQKKIEDEFKQNRMENS